MKFLAVLFALALFVMQAQAADYLRTCRDIRTIHISTRLHLTGSCQKVDGSWRNSNLDLNKCLMNNYGYIGFQRNGNFQWSCNITPGEFSFTGQRMFEIMCRDGRGGRGRSITDLNIGIKNSDGQLACEWE